MSILSVTSLIATGGPVGFLAPKKRFMVLVSQSSGGVVAECALSCESRPTSILLRTGLRMRLKEGKNKKRSVYSVYQHRDSVGDGYGCKHKQTASESLA